MGSSDLLQKTVAGLLEEVASETPAPGGGAVAALSVALGASLVEMVAGFSRRSWDGAGAALTAAHAVRTKVAALAQADADAYTDLLAARRRPAGDSGRDAALEAAHLRAVGVPLEVAASASEVAALGADLAEWGNPNLRGDAVAAALTASAAAEVSAKLVEINVEARADERLARARDLAAAASSAAARALVISGRSPTWPS